jgi:peptidoglycan/xylan/chitin deacetylase (PgdA/CDA1 family)
MRILYPEGRKKALTFSYDDGQAYDRQLVGIFDRYGLKATFHLNSGTLDEDGYVSSGEVRALYANHEVACHGVHHAYFTHLTKEQLVNEVWNDRRNLEKLVGYPVRGISYPYGEYSEEVICALETLGFEYSRTVQNHGSFKLPGRFLEWNPTCHHNGGILEKAEQFLNTPEYAHLPLFYIWGHSFNFGREGNWSLIEQFCQRISGRDDVWYATNLQVKRYLCAARGLIFDTEETMVYNPSAETVWLESGGCLHALAPGQKLVL